MTFEDFLHESQVGFSTIETRDDLEYVIERTWNAAIASSLNAVDAVLKQNIDENDVHVYIYEDLKKLLTSK